MGLELDIAKRLAQATDGARRSVMERIAVVAVALSVAVMILSMAVMMGFKREISRKLAAFSSHALVTDVRSVYAVDADPIRLTPRLDSLIRHQEGFVRMAPYALRSGIIRTSDAIEGVLLKGVDSTYDQAAYTAWLVEGTLPRIGEEIRTKELLLPRRLAERLELRVGDRVELLFIEADAAPFRDRYKVSGIYASGMDELDRMVVVTDLRNVQHIGLWAPDEVTGVEIITEELDRATDFAAQLDRAILYDESEGFENLTAQSVQRLYPNIFDWLKAHDVNAAVILVIMLTVAFFNISTALLILIFERIRMIGILKALGMTNGSLRRIFRYRAAMIALRGLIWGNGVGLAICWLQKTFAWVKLDAEGYLLSAVPIAVEWGWWLLLNAGFAVAIYLLMLLPTSVVAGVKPDETMRYE